MIRFERDAEGRLVALSTHAVGAREIALEVPVGHWDGKLPGVVGLGGLPVVVLPGDDNIDLALAGVRRSGRIEPALFVVEPDLLKRLLRAEAEVAIATEGGGPTLEAVRGLGGRPLPCLPLPDREAIGRFLSGCRVDLELAIPAVDGRRRADVRAAIASLIDLHHVVEVDPKPAFEELGLDPSQATFRALAAAAAGVLAGRLAAANRRWRAEH